MSLGTKVKLNSLNFKLRFKWNLNKKAPAWSSIPWMMPSTHRLQPRPLYMCVHMLISLFLYIHIYIYNVHMTRRYVYAYLHAYIHACVHTYVRTYILTYSIYGHLK